MKKKKILYLGNKLESHGFNKTHIETLGPLLESEGYAITYASSKRNFVLRILDMLVAILKNQTKADYVLIDTYSTKAFWYAFLCSQLCRVFQLKYIPILHGGDLPQRLHNNKRLSQLIFNYAFINVAPSSYLQAAFEEQGYTNVVLIPNTIELTQYKFKKRLSFAPNVLWVRAFAQIYNPKMAIDVLVALQKTMPDATLTMVGPDKDGSLTLTKAYAKSLRVAVTFTGKLSKQDWWKLAENNDIFINTTHFDNTPVSVLEAMALGLPIVSTNVGGIPFLLQHNKNALLVEDNNALEMTNEITRICKESNLGLLLVENGSKLISEFDWEHVKLKWLDLLE